MSTKDLTGNLAVRVGASFFVGLLVVGTSISGLLSEGMSSGFLPSLAGAGGIAALAIRSELQSHDPSD